MPRPALTHDGGRKQGAGLRLATQERRRARLSGMPLHRGRKPRTRSQRPTGGPQRPTGHRRHGSSGLRHIAEPSPAAPERRAAGGNSRRAGNPETRATGKRCTCACFPRRRSRPSKRFRAWFGRTPKLGIIPSKRGAVGAVSGGDTGEPVSGPPVPVGSSCWHKLTFRQPRSTCGWRLGRAEFSSLQRVTWPAGQRRSGIAIGVAGFGAVRGP